MAVLVDRSRFKGYDIGPDSVTEGDLDALETDVSPNDFTTFAVLDLEDDEFQRLGQGSDRGPEYTRGRIHMTLDDGAGNEPDDQTAIRVVKLSSQNNVQNTLYRGKYRQLSNGANDDVKRVPLPEEGNEVISDPSRIGIRAKSGSGSTYTVSLADSNIEIDTVSGER